MREEIRQLIRDAPAIHGRTTYPLLFRALEHIAATVVRGDRTIETGAGYSTVVLALAGAEHTCIVPEESEVAAIRAYCERRGVSLDRVTFHVAPSEDILPTLDPAPLDLALIDGSHSFPQVFIDWFYLADALRVGATLIVDDTHLWTARVLRDFLAAEPSWRLDATFAGRTAVFTKTGDVDLRRNWSKQSYVARRSGLRRMIATAREIAWMLGDRTGRWIVRDRLSRCLRRRSAHLHSSRRPPA